MLVLTNLLSLSLPFFSSLLKHTQNWRQSCILAQRSVTHLEDIQLRFGNQILSSPDYKRARYAAKRLQSMAQTKLFETTSVNELPFLTEEISNNWESSLKMAVELIKEGTLPKIALLDTYIRALAFDYRSDKRTASSTAKKLEGAMTSLQKLHVELQRKGMDSKREARLYNKIVPLRNEVVAEMRAEEQRARRSHSYWIYIYIM